MTQSSPLLAQFCLLLATLLWAAVPDSALPSRLIRLRTTLQRDQMNEADYERMERGYYERLLDAGRRLDSPIGTGAWAPAAPLPAHTVAIVPFDAGPLTLTVDDMREYVLKPNVSVVRTGGVTWSTNEHGMRDRSYPTARPPRCRRIALIGDSIGSGWGVNDGAGFEPRLERAFDARSRAAGGGSVEILNFAVPGYAPGQRWANFERAGWQFEPDLVVYEATLADPGWDERRLRGLLPRGLGWDEPMYRDALARSGVRPGGTMESYKEPLKRSRWDLLAGVYRTIVARCRARSVPCVWVLIPRVGKSPSAAECDRLVALARRAGFSAVLDLSDAFNGLPADELAIDLADFHPNVAGHELLARRLEAALVAQPVVSRLLTQPNVGTDQP